VLLADVAAAAADHLFTSCCGILWSGKQSRWWHTDWATQGYIQTWQQNRCDDTSYL